MIDVNNEASGESVDCDYKGAVGRKIDLLNA